MKKEPPKEIKELQDFWNTPIYRTASKYSEEIAKRWNLLGMTHGRDVEERKQILCICRSKLKEHPSDFDFAFAAGVVHDAVSTLAWNEQNAKLNVHFSLELSELPPEKDGQYRLLRAVAADILVHFPHEIKEFLGKGKVLDEEFSVKWLYVFHCAIAQSASRCLQYLDIHVPDEEPLPRYYPAFFAGPDSFPK